MTQFYPLLGPLALWLAAWWIDRGMPDRKARMISLSAAGVSLVATLAPGLVLRSSLLPAAIAATATLPASRGGLGLAA